MAPYDSLRSPPSVWRPDNPTPSFTPTTFTPGAIPPPPTLPVQNPSNLPRESFLRDLLDPSKATYLGNKYRPHLQRAGRDFRLALEGFGDYDFSETGEGITRASRRETGQPGRLYKEAYGEARNAANEAGMLYSTAAEEAVGQAWHRLGEQERGIFNQYSDITSEIIGRMQEEFTGAVTELGSLYGQDVQYALDNPIIPPPAPEPPAASGGGGGQRQWTGKNSPDLEYLSRVWGIPVSQIRVTRPGTGGYLARPR